MAKKKVLSRFEGFVMIVKENISTYEKTVLANGRAAHAQMVHELMRERALSEHVERMYLLGLDGQSNVMFTHEVSRGGMHGCAVTAKDLLRVALMGGASAFILVHNHPSGDPTPSQEDIVMTRKVKNAADVVGLSLVDHIVIGSWNKFASLNDKGLM